MYRTAAAPDAEARRARSRDRRASGMVDRVDAARDAGYLHLLADGARVFVSGNGVVTMALPGAADHVALRER